MINYAKDVTEYSKLVNSTDRTRGGCVGKQPLCYRYALEKIAPMQAWSIDTFWCDFGAGKYAPNVLPFTKAGINIAAYDIGDNWNDDVHLSFEQFFDDRTQFDVIIASNVFNVQPSRNHIVGLALLLKAKLKDHGILICNYPKQPRKSDVAETGFVAALQYCEFGVESERYHSGKVYVCHKAI